MEEKPILEKQFNPPQVISKFFLIIIIFLTALIAGTGGYWLGRRTQQTSSNTKQVETLPTQVISKPSSFPQTTTTAKIENQDIYAFDGTSINKLLSFTYHNPTNYLEYSPAVGNDMVYYVDNNSVKSIYLQTQETKTVYENKNVPTQIRDVAFYDPNTLVIELGEPGSTGGGGSYYAKYYFLFFDLSTQKTRLIGPFENTQVYGDFSYLFSTTSNNDIIANGGSDGCGGGTEISRVTNNTQTVIIKAGVGSSTGDEFIGKVPDKNSILMAARTVDTASPDGAGCPTATYNYLYLQDVTTSNKTTLFNLKIITDPIVAIHFDQTNHSAVIETKKDIVILDKTNMSVQNTIPKNDLFLDNPRIVDSNMYITDTQNRQLEVINLATGKLQVFPETTYFGGNEHDPSYTGIWHNQPLFYTSYSK